MGERQRSRKFIKSGLAATLGLSLLAGCSDTKSNSWTVGIECKGDAKLDVTKVGEVTVGRATIELVCRDQQGAASGPEDIQLLAGKGTVVEEDKTDLEKLTISYEYNTNLGGPSQSPEISFETKPDKAVVTAAEITNITKVSNTP